MKKIFSFLLTVATTLAITTSCADIPMPYELIDENPSEKIEAAGDGTKDNPFNVAGIIKYTKGLEADKNSDKEVYFTGIICNDPNIDNGQYGNATYYISDDGSTSNQFYIFRGFDLGNVKFTSKEAIKKGDKVVICGTVVNYKGNTPETVANKSYLVSINGTTSGNGGTGTTTVVGTKEAPLTVAAAKAVTSGSGYVTGYIVGYIDGQKLAEGAKFEAASAAETELLLADAADCKDATLVLPVQLPVGDLRTKLNPNIAENIGKKVVLYGSFENYFGTMGMKSTSWAKIDGTEVGKDPDAPVVPIGEAKGDGTKENPFNVAGIIKYTTALGADKNSDKEVYFEGIISDDPNVDTGQYGNATFKISDDGTDNNTFYIFRAFDINNAKFTTKNIKKGDKVVICGTVVNYKGNTPETAANKAYLVSINGTTEGGNTTGGDDSGNTGGSTGTSEGVTIDGTTVTLANSAATAGEETVSFSIGSLDFESPADVPTIEFGDGTTLTISQGENKNAPRLYELKGKEDGSVVKELRAYAGHILTFAGKSKIAKIVIECNTADGKVTVGDNTATLTFENNNVIYVPSTTSGVQLRVLTITITYAK